MVWSTAMPIFWMRLPILVRMGVRPTGIIMQMTVPAARPAPRPNYNAL